MLAGSMIHRIYTTYPRKQAVDFIGFYNPKRQ